MRKAIYFCLMIITFFCAGFYQNALLMMLFLVECILLACGWIVVRYFAKYLKIFIQMDQEKRCGEVVIGKITVKNEGRLPIPFFELRIEYENETIKNKPGHKKRKGFVGAEEETVMEFQMLLMHSGIFGVAVRELRVYDYLSLFSKKKKEEEKAAVMVIPKETEKFIFPEEIENFTVQEEVDHAISSKEPPIIEGVRAYQAGDSLKDIHWKLSAREDSLYSKIYQKDTIRQVSVYADISHRNVLDETDLDAFLEMLYAVQKSLLKQGMMISFWWFDQKESSATIIPIHKPEDISQGLLMLLFHIHSKPQKISEKEEKIYQKQMQEEVLFRITMNLECYIQENLVVSYTKEA